MSVRYRSALSIDIFQCFCQQPVLFTFPFIFLHLSKISRCTLFTSELWFLFAYDPHVLLSLISLVVGPGAFLANCLLTSSGVLPTFQLTHMTFQCRLSCYKCRFNIWFCFENSSGVVSIANSQVMNNNEFKLLSGWTTY